MTRASTWLNDDGLNVAFGTSTGITYEAGTVGTEGKVKELYLVVDYANLPATGTAVQGESVQLPSGAAILSAQLVTTTAFNQAIEVGTMVAAGTVTDKNGLLTTVTPAINTVTVGSGAQINTVLTADQYITIEETTTAPTAGAGYLLVRYIV